MSKFSSRKIEESFEDIRKAIQHNNGSIFGELGTYDNSPDKVAKYNKTRREELVRFQRAKNTGGSSICPICRREFILYTPLEERPYCMYCEGFRTSEIPRGSAHEENSELFYLDDNHTNKAPENVYLLSYHDQREIKGMLRKQKVLLGYFEKNRPAEKWSSCAKRLSTEWLKAKGLYEKSMEGTRSALLLAYDKLQEKLKEKEN